jgi:hypothetical protein
MTERQKVKLVEYIIQKQAFYENDLDKLQQHIRYRRIDAVDCLELILAAERKAHFEEIIGEILGVLRVFRKN